jgi:flagellar hook assembly protein FlgD
MHYGISKSALVEIRIFNQRGQLVREVKPRIKEEGNFTYHWDGRDTAGISCSSGLYLFELKVGNSSYVKKACLLK